MSTSDSLTDVYVYENSQLLEHLEEMLLDSEKNSVLEKAHIDEIFRVMHTIKGSSAMMGYDALMKLAHGMEDMFSPLRQNPDIPKETCENIISLVLECIDFFKGEIAKVQDGLLPDGEIGDLHERAMALMATINGEEAAPKAETAPATIVMPGDPVPETAPAAAEASAAAGVEGMQYYKALLHFTAGCAMESVRAFAVVNSLDGLYARIAHEPKDLNVNCDEAIIANGLLLYLETNCERDEIEARLGETLFLQSLEFSEVPAAEALAAMGESPASAAAPEPEPAPADPVAAAP